MKRFVLWTGGLDLLMGLAAVISTLFATPNASFHLVFVIGGFLMFCGAVLMWASRDLKNRGPVVFWQGLVRLMAVGINLYALRVGVGDSSLYAATVMDSIIGPIYLIGITRLLGIPLHKVFLGRTS